MGLPWNVPREPILFHGIPRDSVGNPNRSHGIPRASPQGSVPFRGTPWHAVGPRGTVVHAKNCRWVLRQFPWEGSYSTCHAMPNPIMNETEVRLSKVYRFR